MHFAKYIFNWWYIHYMVHCCFCVRTFKFYCQLYPSHAECPEPMNERTGTADSEGSTADGKPNSKFKKKERPCLQYLIL